MPLSEKPPLTAAAVNQLERPRVDCYVRSAVPTALTETIEDVVSRLWSLCERDLIDDVRVRQWPARTADAIEARTTREDLLAEFERWATRRGVSLEPAFRREVVPPAPFERGNSEPCERIQVPMVALALYERDGETESLREVVPHTDRSYAGTGETRTVHDWFEAAESNDPDGIAPAPGNRRISGELDL